MRHQRNPRHHCSPSEEEASSRTRIGNAFVNCGEDTSGVRMKRSKRASISEALCPCIGSAKQMKSRANPIMRRDPQKEMGNIFGSRAMKRRACSRPFVAISSAPVTGKWPSFVPCLAEEAKIKLANFGYYIANEARRADAAVSVSASDQVFKWPFRQLFFPPLFSSFSAR